MKNLKRISVLFALLFVTLMSQSFTHEKEGSVVMIISLEVKNFEEWKKGFDAGAPIREKAGIKVLSVCQATENPNKVIVIEEVDSVEKANGFIELLKSKQQAGEISNLEFQLFDKVE